MSLRSLYESYIDRGIGPPDSNDSSDSRDDDDVLCPASKHLICVQTVCSCDTQEQMSPYSLNRN